MPALCWLALVGSLALDFVSPRPDGAVLLAAETTAHAADSNHAPARFAQPLPGGTEVEIEEERGVWVRVRLANARTGWVRAGSLERVRSASR